MSTYDHMLSTSLSSRLPLDTFREGGIEDLIKVLPDLQANIRRFLAVRKYEAIKEEKKKVEVKERKVQQRERMLALSKPRGPAPPKSPRGKSVANTSPAMQSRTKVEAPARNLTSSEFRTKYERTALAKPTKAPPVKTLPPNTVPVDKWDRDMTELMRNVDQITLTLNMYDATILPHTAKKNKRRGGDSDGPVYFNPDARSDGQSKNLSPGKVTPLSGSNQSSPQAPYSDKVRAILANIEAEYATLARTNQQIKQALATEEDGNGNSTTAAQAYNPQTSQYQNINQQTSSSNMDTASHASPTRLALSNLALSQGKLEQIPEGDGRSATTAAAKSSSGDGSYTYNSSLVTNDSDAYIPIRRSGDAKLDIMVQETLIRANNSIQESATPEKLVQENDELKAMLHNVVLQLNSQLLEDDPARKTSVASVDSVGLDALTRSITALQAAGKAGSNQPTPSASQFNSTNPTTDNSLNNSANNSVDSHHTADTQDSNQTTVSELTVAIQDILANLSGGIFDRARLEFSAIDLEVEKQYSPNRSVAVKSVTTNPSESTGSASGAYDDSADAYGGNIGDTIMAQVRSEMRRPSGDGELLSKTPPLEMSDYLESVYQRNQAYASSNSPGKNSTASKGKISSLATSVLDSLDYMENKASRGLGASDNITEQEKADLQLLLHHQERSMQLIRASIQAIERGETLEGMELPALRNAVMQQAGVREDSAPRPIESSGTDGLLPLMEESANYSYGKKAKSKGKKGKKSSKFSPSAAEHDMLRNLGDHLRREKERIIANKNLTYDELMRKAHADMGMGMHSGGGGGYPPQGAYSGMPRASEEAYQLQLRANFLQQQLQEKADAERYRKKTKKLLAANAHLIVDTRAQGDEDGVENVAHKTIGTISYTESQQLLFNRRLELEREIEAYNKSHKVPLPGSPREGSARWSSSEKDEGSVGKGSPTLSQKSGQHVSKEPFNMSEALLRAPGYGSGEKEKKKKLTFNEREAEYVVPQSYSSASSGKKYPDQYQGYQGQSQTSASAPQWNDRFSAKDDVDRSKIGFGVKAEDLRESAEEMYEAQRQARLRERKAEIEEYRRSYLMADDAEEEDGGGNEEEQDYTQAHTAAHTMEPPAPQDARKRKSGKKSAKSKKQQSGDFDEKLLTTIEMLNVRAPTSIKSSVAAAHEHSPRRNIARLMHPFK